MLEPVIAQKAPYAVELEAGKTYHFCTCGISKKQPFCDGAHKGTEFKSKPFIAEKSGTGYLCGCKYSKNGHLCDGAHKNL